MNRFSPLLRSRFLKLAAVLLIIAAIPFTVFVAQQQQENRQRAAEPLRPVDVSITNKGVLSVDAVTLLSHEQGLVIKNEDNRDYAFYNTEFDSNSLSCAFRPDFVGFEKIGNKVVIRPGTSVYKKSFAERRGNCELRFGNSDRPDLKLKIILPATAASLSPLEAKCSVNNGGDKDNYKYEVNIVIPQERFDKNTFSVAINYLSGKNPGGANPLSLSLSSPRSRIAIREKDVQLTYYEFSKETKQRISSGDLKFSCPDESGPTPTSAVAPSATPVPTRSVGPGNPTRVPNQPNAGRCEGDVTVSCGDPNKLVASWTVSGQNGLCNIYLQAGEPETISRDCSGTKEITRFHGNDPLNTEGNPINNGETYQLGVSNGGSCSKMVKEVKVDCSQSGSQPSGNACRNLLPNQTEPANPNLGDKYQWVADCSKPCVDTVKHTDCQQNTTQPQFVAADKSNWCYGFKNTDGTESPRCMKLTYFANGAPANPTPTQVSSPVPTAATKLVPTGDFENKPAKICNTTNQCQNGKLTCEANACRFIPDNNPSNIIGCAKSELSSSCRISLLSTASEPAQPSEPPWWCVVLENTPLACGSGVSQQTPSSSSGFGFGWFNPFFGK